MLQWGTQNQSTSYAQSPRFNDKAYWSNLYLADQALRNSSVSVPAVTGKESISWKSGGKAKYNPCIHIVSNMYNLPYTAVHERVSNPKTIYVSRYFRTPSPALYPYALRNIVHPTTDFQAARARAWHNMQPRFEGKVSMINFLYELKDFRDIVKYLFRPDNNRALKDIRKLFNKKRPDLVPKDPTRGLATAVLVNNFAIQPLIKDLAAMLQQANIIVREAQQQFCESGSQFQKSHYSEEIHRIDSRTKYTNNNYWYAYGQLQNTIFTATLRYKYDYTMRNTIDAWMKYWGFCGSFEAWWNMIPFSFLVDYFVQIGNSIHAMEHDPHVRLTEYEYGESLRTTYRFGYSTTGDPRHHVFVLDGNVYLKARGDKIGDRLYAGIQGSIYTRTPTYPYYGPATPRLKLPSTTQMLNMGALLRCLL